MSGNELIESLEGVVIEAVTPPPKIDLRNANAIRREIAAVYRDMRAGRIEPQDGTKLAYVLNFLSKAYETAVMEERLEMVERTIKNRSK